MMSARQRLYEQCIISACTVNEVEQESHCLTAHGGGLPHLGARTFLARALSKRRINFLRLLAFVPWKSCKLWLRVMTIA